MSDADRLKDLLTVWFKQGGGCAEVLLPQNLPDELLEKLVATEFSLTLGDDIDRDMRSPVVMCVGLFLSPEGKPFEASKEMLLAFARSYHFNVLMEQLRRAGIVSIEVLPSLDDVFDLSKERRFQLTDFGRQCVTGAGEDLSDSLRRGLSGLTGGATLKH